MKQILLAFLFAAFVATPLAHAEGSSAGVSVSVHADTGMQAGDDHGDSAAVTGSTSVTASSKTRTDDAAMDAQGEDGSMTASTSGQFTAEEHRSAVASFVQSIIKTANEDGGIGARVRAVAQSQEDAASTTAEAMIRVQERNAFLSFLAGTDWKSIGSIRAAIATTSADIAQLQAALSSTTDATVRAQLQANIQTLTQEQTRLESFVSTHVNQFSLFGWFTRLFVQAGS